MNVVLPFEAKFRDEDDLQSILTRRSVQAIKILFVVGALLLNGCGGRPPPRNVDIRMSKYPQSAAHIRDAQRSGRPEVLTVDRPGAKANRKASLRGVPRRPGQDRDEYPPATFREGGAGASVRHISPGDNRGAGSSMRHQMTGVKDGEQVRLRVVP